MAKGNKILGFDKLVEYSRECSGDVFQMVARLRKRHHERFPHNPTFWERIYPKAEVLRLRAFIECMRSEEQLAAKNALDLYAENESLRRYKLHYNGNTHQFVSVDEYNKVCCESAQWRDKCDAVERALSKQHNEWTEYMMKQRTAPKK
jgi:hypothetical protein